VDLGRALAHLLDWERRRAARRSPAWQLINTCCAYPPVPVEQAHG
jgi:hypothetical protein